MARSKAQKRKARREHVKTVSRDTDVASSIGLDVEVYRRAKQLVEASIEVEGNLFASIGDEDGNGDSGEFTPVPYSGQAYGGGDIRQAHVPYPIVVNLATATVAKPNGLQPLLKDHKADRAMGQHRAVITATEMRVEDGSISIPNAHSREVITGARNKFPWQASIRGRWGKLSFLKAGATRVVNGRTIEGPRFIAENFVWRETTVTGLGADQDGPELQIAASEGDAMNEFEKWLKKMGLDKASMSADQIKAAQESFDAIQASADDDDDGDDPDLEASDDDGDDPDLEASDDDTPADDEVAAADRVARRTADRVRKSAAKAYAAGQRQIALAEKVFGTDSCYGELRASAVEEGWDESRMRDARKLYDFEHGGPAVRNQRRGSDLPNEAEIIAASMSLQTNNITAEQLEDDFGVSEAVLNEAMTRPYRGIGFHGLIRAAAAEAGIPLPHHIGPEEYARLAEEIQGRFKFMRDSGQITASQGWTTLNLASINENVMNRSIHGRFMRMESIIPAIAREANARDFRPHKKYRLYGAGFFKKLGATGEIEHLKFGDAGFSNEVDTSAGMVTIPRKAIANDELDVFSQVGDSLAETAFDTREKDFIYMLLTPGLWRTSETTVGEAILSINALAAGASSAFSIDALALADDILANQKDRGGKPIRVGGDKVILTHAGAMAREAKRIHESEWVMDVASGTKSSRETGKKNTFYGELERRVSTQWMNHSEMGTRKTATAWFMFCDPAVQAFLEIMYLNGRKVPYVETADAAFNVLGQQMRSYWEYGMAQIDDVGAVYSPGA